ncbi:rRNA primary transcript binding protein [Trichosporon asahii var. asahii CBS 8904]|uniref:U3 small nucleolar ribonucleoprotein protein IMP4 n=2 Tax=Trichosporon asahii var. asahii TaxID=189963 RepID=K1VES3_TRIAC|nr:rRNA primary transcript binding protein [Trichosporon asahii var. asahii CBS 2479]EJT48769.1 rRNA primary transcript binding protein [Trichosporon asahii var. asahii CBS 2479]EKC97546.1 rRNA primary transcript binding protein [Trichosporon asahii var. asahii CBS 8904]
MLRRQSRERREYLFKKSHEAQERAVFDRKQRLKDALASGKALPNELKADARAMGKDLALDEAQTEMRSHVDDEYAKVGTYDPKVVVTTSRDPSSRLTQFAKELRLCFPNAIRLNRGNTVMKDLVQTCLSQGVTDLVLVHEHRGVPDAMIVSHLPHGPTLSMTLNNVTLRHDVATSDSTVSEQYPHLIMDGFTTRLGERVASILKALFPVPKDDAKRVMTFANQNDFISFRHHVFAKTSHKDVQLAEVGPRFEAKPYEIRQGTVDQTEADVEWLLRPYMRTSKKRNQL